MVVILYLLNPQTNKIWKFVKAVTISLCVQVFVFFVFDVPVSSDEQKLARTTG